MERQIKRLLIANRGEIALRIIRTTRRLGIHSIAIFSDADAEAMHTLEADEAWALDSNELSESYLSIPKIMEIARLSQADALHPGYGFLAENPALVKACEDAGILFVGPGSEAMRLMGNKIHAREFVRKIGGPLIEGYTGSPDELLNRLDPQGFPYLVKAAAGGGGKGMRIAHDAEELKAHLVATSREAKNYFGDGTVYIERFLEQPRHIEIQILGDKHGHVLHLFERECSVQRRYQKIIEEAPSPTLDHELRMKMGQSAVEIASAISYTGAGTMEFLVDQKLNFYFLEMNTRIQVEHPVTEMITGIDIVEQQIRIAEGHPLPFSQSDLQIHGHAIEFRVYAEDAMQEFMPSPGYVSYCIEPEGEGIRVDTALVGEEEVHGFYDPMISKLVVHAPSRDEAIERSANALQDYIIHGIRTNLPLLYHFTQSEDFLQNRVHTRYCDVNYAALQSALLQRQAELMEWRVPLAFMLRELRPNLPENLWEEIGYWRDIMEIPLRIDGNNMKVRVLNYDNEKVRFRFGSKELEVEFDDDDLQAIISDQNHLSYLSMGAHCFEIERLDILHKDDFFIPPDHNGPGDGAITSPMPGKVLKINVEEGQDVNRGEVLLIVEAMKMENSIVAPRAGRVINLNVEVGEMVDTRKHLVLIHSEEL
jgi:3-methylcrotonyl-CoA carboxylase alpha subunit